MKIDAYALRDAVRDYFKNQGAEVIRESKDKKGREFFVARVGDQGVYKISVERVS